MPITAQDVANADLINGLSLSASGDRVALWLADVGVAESARKITCGLFNDQNPKFHPTSGDVIFLSDRHKAGSIPQLYRLSSREFGGDPEPLTPMENIRGVTSFEISPNGRWLAYTSADEPADKDEEKKDTYVIIWRAPKEFGRLRIIDLSDRTKEIQTVVSENQHVQSFTWSPDNTQILYRLANFPGLESEVLPISENIVSIEEAGGSFRFNSTHVVTHDPLLFSGSIWTKPGIFHFLHTEDYASAPALWTCRIQPGAFPTRVAFGETDDAARLVHVGGEVAVEVACGLETRIHIFGSDAANSFTAFETSQDAFSGWDIKHVNGKYIFVVARSSGVTGTVENLWSGSTTPGTKGVLTTKLSSHHEWMSAKEMPQCAPFEWTTEDGTALEGVAAYPRGQLLENLPTVVVPHGGPYGDTVNLRVAYPNQSYRQLFASHGFLVLSPNYRGSQGYGNDFAQASKGGMGTLDYADVESMVEAAISRGYADRDKVAIAGWSQGGFLSAWACTRPNSIWKTAIITAGATDWGSMAICTDVPAAEASLSIIFIGSAPWTPRHDPQEIPQYLKGCPIADVNNVKVPVLVIHGEKDERVPLTQAIGFMRGLESEADKAASGASVFLIYPREGHVFEERTHVEDHLTRVLAHIQKYLA
ncbi:Peptidase-S9 domain-containing protein [Mycena sanguinolenta]|uniref:Dipeptidyl-peptidase V n=1 Tax=Mycena sanguinolenta TaxID=230812 RepID=A0A8H6Z6Q4_9AGAR|nr:Peptidase-S9 domain-containing protein [Mycena sanguinolenta]